MAETWTVKAILRTGFLLIDEQHQVVMQGDDQDPSLIGYPNGTNTRIHFGWPRRVEDAGWSSWDVILAPAWDYDVSISFSAEDEHEAQAIAWPLLEKIAGRLSFFGSSPVALKSPGGLTNAPEQPAKGTQYKFFGFADQPVTALAGTPRIGADQVNLVLGNLLRLSLREKGGERIDRSMRWLQQSYHALSPTVEFLCLMLSLESMSYLLKGPEPRYWHCNACGETLKVCPKCGANTNSGTSAVPSMRDFVCRKPKPGWSKRQWTEVWRLRNKIVHGEQDLSREEQRTIATQLRNLEEVVVNALRYLLRLPPKAPPSTLRPRGKFHDAMLKITYTTAK